MSSFGPAVRSVYAVKLAGTLAPLHAGDTLLGRGAGCDIVIPSEKASRTHAKITVDQAGVFVEDLQSTNGVYVNDEPISGRVKLSLRDAIRIGDVSMRLVYFDDMKLTHRGDPLASAIADDMSGDADTGDATKQAHAFDIVGPLVEKMLTLGRVDEAERLIEAPLRRILSLAEQGTLIEVDISSKAAAFCVKLAESSRRPQWIDLLIKTHAALRRTLPLAVVDDLYRVLRTVRGVDHIVLKDYIEQLESRTEAMGPTERFALKRIVGLRQIAAG